MDKLPFELRVLVRLDDRARLLIPSLVRRHMSIRPLEYVELRAEPGRIVLVPTGTTALPAEVP